LKGKKYFVDQRLDELRNVDNPHDRLDLQAVITYFNCGGK
jgi:hypothetical protein